MTHLSHARRDTRLMERRPTLLLLAGALAGLFPLPGRTGAEPQKPTTMPPGAPPVPGFPDLKRLGPANQVRTIGYRGGTFRVTTGDGQTADFRESNLRFKIDSTDAGPLRGAPVILPAGTMGDRAWVFFAAPAEIGSFIQDQG